MEFTGTIFKVGEIQTGQGTKGEWRKQEVVIEQDSGKFKSKLALMVWNDLTAWDFQVGKTLTVEANVESREHNGRFFTEVKVWKIK